MISGTGDVYRTNPLHGSPTSVTLHRLRDVSPRELYGFDVDINDRFGNDATSSSGSFHYSPSDHRFDQVMSYYHSDEFEAWLVGDLGMSSTCLDGEVDVETRSNQCYACMEPSNQNAYFSDGSGYTLKNPTRERSIVAHEYMHAVSHQYNTLDQSFNAEALNEGYSDFFAVADRHANTSVTSKRLGAYVGLGSGRTVDNDYQLSEFENGKDLTGGGYSEHDGGVVLAGALWDFKQNIGSATLVAEITLESLNYLDSDPSFYDARSTMLTAADGTGNSQYECDIKRAFEEHGIGGSGLLVSISGPNELDGGEEGTWTTSVACPGSSISYQWYEKYASDDSFTAISGATSSSYTASYYGDVDLKVEITSDGYAASDVHSVTVNCDRACTASIEEARALSGSSEDRPGGARTTRGQTERPDAFALRGSTPNPVRTQATIRYAMPGAADVTLTVYDVMGRHVATLTEGRRSVGVHEVTLEATGLPSGVYLYRLQAGSYRETKRLVVVK